MKKIFNFNNICIPYYDLNVHINFKNKNVDIRFDISPAYYLEYEDKLISGSKLLSFMYNKNFWMMDAFLMSTFWPANDVLALNFVGDLTE